MPIYEYRCQECGETFEKFVRSAKGPFEVECPECHSTDCKKALSMFGSGSRASGSVGAASSCAPSG